MKVVASTPHRGTRRALGRHPNTGDAGFDVVQCRGNLSEHDLIGFASGIYFGSSARRSLVRQEQPADNKPVFSYAPTALRRLVKEMREITASRAAYWERMGAGLCFFI